jgi:hypothetical protein
MLEAVLRTDSLRLSIRELDAKVGAAELALRRMVDKSLGGACAGREYPPWS